jgi:hypothetical protein
MAYSGLILKAVIGEIPASAWTPLVQVSATGRTWLGRDSRLGWIVGREGRSAGQIQADEPGLWPLLERSYDKLLSEIRSLAPATGESADMLVESFPIAEVLNSALSDGGEHWKMLALEWLETNPQLSLPRETLEQLASSSKDVATQRTRHRAKSLLGRAG